jgi:aryl-alcohol dehydrogenase-like predicted oxidoreductase
MLAARPIGSTGLVGTPLVFGSAPLATGWWNNTEEVAVATVAAALAAGITWFDTAPLYGSGDSEERVGAGLAAGLGSGPVTLATKVGRPFVGTGDAREAVFDYSAAGVRASLEASLTRLGRDHVEIVHIHDPDVHLEQALDEALPELVAMRDEGLLRAISVGTMSCASALHMLRNAELDLVMIANRLTLLEASALDELLPECRGRGVPLLAAAVFNSGVLARPTEPGVWFDYAPADAAMLARVEAMAAACNEAGVSLKAAAMQFPLQHDGVAAVVVGMATPAQVAENVALFEQPIPDDLWPALATC